MAAGILDLPIEQGATYRFSLLYEVELHAGSGDYVAVDLTGCTARMQIRQKHNLPVLLEVTSEGSDEIVIQPAAEPGRITVCLSDEKTEVIDLVKKALYDLDVEFPSGDVVRLIQGAVAISQAITEETA